MTYTVGTPVVVLVSMAGAIVALSILFARSARTGRTLRASEERFRLIADRAPVLLWTARPDTTLDYLNMTCVEFTGLPLAQLLDEGWLNSVHPEDVARITGIYVTAIEARQPFFMEYRIRCADGIYRWILDSGIPKYGADGNYTGYIGSSIDITARKEAEDQIRQSSAALEASNRQIQQLAGRLIEAQDAERARIARDLHDDVSQQLAGMSIAFSGLKQRMGELAISNDLQDDLLALQQRTNALAKNVRHVSHDLHPTVLRHGGLVAALTTYCAELERVHGSAFACHAEGDFASIAPEPALCLYRVAQEALRNITAHAGASLATVHLARTGDATEMTITDNGKGFAVATALESGSGLGLVSISERVRIAAGTVSILTEAGKGTCLRIQIPSGSRLTTDSVAENDYSSPSAQAARLESQPCAEPLSCSPTTTPLSPRASLASC